ncbi:MAG: FAD-binding protein [Coriobacteriales bacterium]|jgi:succinate dehydrogenase/fumarate reductase flavoprotein subunit|nr:FAD-binding protein [Coriobacteriales bacterium]
MAKAENLSRRGFLAGAAALGGSIALTACSPQSDSSGSGGADSEAIAWDKVVDVLAVGSSGAAYGALAAKEAGAASVMIIEKGDIFGGTTSFSGGGHWTPCNHVMAEAGYEDNRNDALAYISWLANNKSSPELQASYVDNSLDFIAWTMEKYNYVWNFGLGEYPDYAPDHIPGFRVGRMITIDDVTTVKNVTGETIEHIRYAGGSEFKCIRFLCEQNDIEVMMMTAGKMLYKNDLGEVVGVLAEDSSGTEIKIGVNKGVILGTGGFDYDGDMCRAYLSVPYAISCAVPTNTGDGHKMGMGVGAALANMIGVNPAAGWLPEGEPKEDGSMINDQTQAFMNIGGTTGKPNSLMVNSRGERMGDEASSYGNLHAMWAAWSTYTLQPMNVPAYFICDSTFVQYYAFKGYEVGEIPPFVAKADTLEELADVFGIDIDGLNATLAVFNPNAKAGIDPIWHRGEGTNRGDASGTRTDLANPSLGPVETPPFYGTRIYPAMLGTIGGLKTNSKAQVLDVFGNPIPRLFACGGTAGSPFGPSYPGGGAPVGSSCTMGWVAGRTAMDVEVK